MGIKNKNFPARVFFRKGYVIIELKGYFDA